MHEDEVEAPVGQVSDETSESDTESLPDPEFEEVCVKPDPKRKQFRVDTQTRSPCQARSKEETISRAQVMRTVPFFMRGILRGGFRVASMKSFQEGSQGTGTARNEVVLLGSPDVVASTR